MRTVLFELSSTLGRDGAAAFYATLKAISRTAFNQEFSKLDYVDGLGARVNKLQQLYDRHDVCESLFGLQRARLDGFAQIVMSIARQGITLDFGQSYLPGLDTMVRNVGVLCEGCGCLVAPFSL